jgi:hypothetical protein
MEIQAESGNWVKKPTSKFWKFKNRHGNFDSTGKPTSKNRHGNFGFLKTDREILLFLKATGKLSLSLAYP